MSDTETAFGKLRLSAKNTCNGSGFDILYDFGKSLPMGEFTSKPEFLFIQPWMQFPCKEYTDTCILVSVELVNRFNEYDKLKKRNQELEQSYEKLLIEFYRVRAIAEASSVNGVGICEVSPIEVKGEIDL